MDTLSIIITLVSVIASALQIVLFFKVWGMCNDIRALRNNTIEQSSAPSNDMAGLIVALISCIGLIFLIGLLIYNS